MPLRPFPPLPFLVCLSPVLLFLTPLSLSVFLTAMRLEETGSVTPGGKELGRGGKAPNHPRSFSVWRAREKSM